MNKNRKLKSISAMKIVHCIFSMNTGGAETMLCDILARQSTDNDVTLVIVNNVYNDELLSSLPDSVKLVKLGRKPSSRSPWFIVQLNTLLRRLRPDVIHLHSFLLPKAIFGLKDKLWYTVHDINIPMTYSSKLHGVIAISDAVAEGIRSTCKCTVVVAPNGINIDKISRKTEYARDEKFRIVQVARLHHEKKGQDLLIRALAELRNRGINDVTIDFIGEGLSEDYLRKLAADLNVADLINFLGLRDRDYIYDHLKDYDLMCHPARYEGFGLVVAEGMAAGLPVLVATEDGPWEVIGQGRYGFGFESENVTDLANKILSIRNNYSDTISLTQLAYDRACESYSVDRMVKQYIDAYDKK